MVTGTRVHSSNRDSDTREHNFYPAQLYIEVITMTDKNDETQLQCTKKK